MSMILDAKQIAAIRKKLGLSQKAFAEQIGVGQPTVAHWERGTRHPKYSVLVKLSRMYEKLHGSVA